MYLNELDDFTKYIIKSCFSCSDHDILDIEVMKKGMTNKSYTFSCFGKKYIIRVPGEGTDKLIKRYQEADVYNVISNKSISDDVIYFDPKTGYKITKFIDNARVCDPFKEKDVIDCMLKLKSFHQLGFVVEHEFDLFNELDYYEKLRGNIPSIYFDYAEVKSGVLELKTFIEMFSDKKVLAHIDSVPDNFLIYKENSNIEIRMIDWEYAGMQDPHIDIAMFAIYSMYNKDQIDKLIDIYFDNNCTKEIRVKIYCYIAVCGLLWSNWCEYKKMLGIEFGEYSTKQYQYAKEFSKIAKEKIESIDV